MHIEKLEMKDTFVSWLWFTGRKYMQYTIYRWYKNIHHISSQSEQLQLSKQAPCLH